MDRKLMRFVNAFKILGILLLIFIVGIFICGLINEELAGAVMSHLSDHGEIYVLVLGGITTILTICMVLYGVKTAKNYRKNLMETKKENRFKYIDTVYYYKHVKHNTEDTNSPMLIAFHILKDANSNKMYAIVQENTNALFQQVLNKTKVLRVDDENKTTTRKDWKEVSYNDTGSLWIDEEINNCYQNDGDKVTISYYMEKDKLEKKTDIFNRNDKYTLAILDEVTFITGYAKFDKK